MNDGSHLSMIEALHGDAPFGTVLDAGTGSRSIRWLTSRSTDSWTAVTGDPRMKGKVERLIGDALRPQDRLLLGNWSDPALLAGETFDTVLADHLLGAIEGFAPYFQTSLFPRLRTLTSKRLYVTGMEPYVIDRPPSEAGTIIWQIGRYRDACLLLLGKQPFREFPLDWVVSELGRSGFRPLDTRKSVAGFGERFVNSQIDLVRPGLERIADQAVGQSLIARGEAIRSRALSYLKSHGALRHGFSYVIAAEPVQ